MDKTQSMVEKHAFRFWEQVKKQYLLLALRKLNGGILKRVKKYGHSWITH